MDEVTHLLLLRNHFCVASLSHFSDELARCNCSGCTVGFFKDFFKCIKKIRTFHIWTNVANFLIVNRMGQILVDIRLYIIHLSNLKTIWEKNNFLIKSNCTNKRSLYYIFSRSLLIRNRFYSKWNLFVIIWNMNSSQTFEIILCV